MTQLRLAASAPTSSPWSLGAAAAVAAMSVLATGDVVLAAALLCVAARDAAVAIAVVPACAASIVRWGTTSLPAVGADQAVLGVAGVVGPAPAAASAWCAAAALVLVPRPRGVPHASFAAGALAGLLLAGPTDAAGWWVRVVATAGFTAAAATVDHGVAAGRVRRGGALAASAVLGAVGVALAVAG